MAADDTSVNVELRSFGITRKDWDHSDELSRLHPWADRMNVAFALNLPQIVLGVDSLRSSVLGHYRRGRNGFGLRYEIVLNAQHGDRPVARKLDTLCHELLHAWQELYGKPGKNKYHNKQFRKRAASLGLVVDKRGYTEYLPGSFSALLDAEGIDTSSLFTAPVLGAAFKSRSRLRRYRCGCTRIWAAVQVKAVCQACGKEFFRV